MIGHFLNSLSAIEEDRVLLGRLRFGSFEPDVSGARCVIAVAYDFRPKDIWNEPRLTTWPPDTGPRPSLVYVEDSFDRLCARFGEPRVNAAIRNRILSNRARRALSRETSLVGVGASRPTGDPA